jgi:hypothetical protein
MLYYVKNRHDKSVSSCDFFAATLHSRALALDFSLQSIDDWCSQLSLQNNESQPLKMKHGIETELTK